MINKKLLRVALYMRVSTEEQALHGLSLEAQDAALTEYANKNGMIIVDRYVDEGITARKKIQNRKALMRLLEDVKAGKIDMIIFTKIDRWMRNIYDYHKVQEVLEQNNVHWKTIFENYDTSTATGRLHINIMLSVAQDEADRTSERIKAVFANKVQNKEYPTRSVPYGYILENGTLRKDPETQHIMDDLFSKFFDTHSLYATQIYSAEQLGVTFAPRTISKIFKNALYCGEYRGVKDFCEPYITREQHDEIKNLLAKKNIKNNKTGRVYLFSGLLICPECGCRMTGAANRYKTKSGLKESRQYRCRHYYETRQCAFNKCINENLVEKYLLKHTATELDKYEKECQIKAAKAKPKKNPQKEIEKTKDKLSRLSALYVNKKIQMDDYVREYDALEAKLNELIAEAEGNKQEEETIDIEAIRNLLSKSTDEIYQTLTAEDRRKFWNGFIDRIVFHSKDNMEIFFK